jgi:hypothetical protein
MLTRAQTVRQDFIVTFRRWWQRQQQQQPSFATSRPLPA